VPVRPSGVRQYACFAPFDLTQQSQQLAQHHTSRCSFYFQLAKSQPFSCRPACLLATCACEWLNQPSSWLVFLFHGLLQCANLLGCHFLRHTGAYRPMSSSTFRRLLLWLHRLLPLLARRFKIISLIIVRFLPKPIFSNVFFYICKIIHVALHIILGVNRNHLIINYGIYGIVIFLSLFHLILRSSPMPCLPC
jgi:hypothetical protein